MKTEISSYDQQALDFLQATQTKFETQFLRFGSMPWDKDGAKRNIFKITLTNSRHSHSFEFGESINNSCADGPMLYTNDETEVYCGFSEGNGIRYFSHKIKTTYPILREIHEGKRTIGDLALNDAKLKADYFLYTETVAEQNKKWKTKFQPIPFERIQSEIIPNAVRRTIQTALNTQTKIPVRAEEIIYPSAYSVLACLTKSDPGTFANFCAEYGYNEDSRAAMRTYKAVCKDWLAVSKLFSDSELEQLQEIN